MAITVSGLQFHALYWVHHDCWRYVKSTNPLRIKKHWGHLHFWMMGFNMDSVSADAFSGEMRFKFELKDIWGPRSGDPNQQHQYRVIGTPKWYFKIEELWRRIYVQHWDHPDNDDSVSDFVGKRGIKYDASQPLHTFGPFRESRTTVPYFLHSPRTLPVEYFLTAEKDRTKRDNYVKLKYSGQPAGSTHYPYTDDFYVPPVGGTQPMANTPGGVPTYADGLYIYPTLEYQRVTQLDWQRLPGYEQKNDVSPTQFGDGWVIETQIPFRDPTTNQYRSPFGPRPGVVDAPGSYHFNLVPPAKQLKFRKRKITLPSGEDTTGSYDHYHRPWGMSEALSEKPLTWQNPYSDRTDGRWVQQCLGGLVQAKAEVIIESKLNNAGPAGYQSVWVHATQYLPQDKFAGSDQKQGSA